MISESTNRAAYRAACGTPGVTFVGGLPVLIPDIRAALTAMQKQPRRAANPKGYPHV